ncbi:MAG: hypothetical protein H8E46_12105 [FCB group bacterium]|nr:hypothetical protein [FCB group bacterium]
MLDKVHQHIVEELQLSSRTDTIFVITAVIFNLIILAVNSGVAASAVSEKANSSDDFLIVIFIMMTIIVNAISISALLTGRSTRGKLLAGLMSMYKDNEVEKYYDASLLTNYNKRYFLFTAVMVCLAVTSIVVPLVVRLA